jgi:hypothetical protein
MVLEKLDINMLNNEVRHLYCTQKSTQKEEKL